VANGIDPYFTATPPNDVVRFPMFYNEGVYDDQQHFTRFVNYNLSESLKPNLIPEYSSILLLESVAFNYNSLCPCVKLSHVFEEIENYFGFEFEGNFIESDFYAKALIHNTKYLDLPIRFLNDKPIIFYKSKFNVSEHLPDMKVADFLKALQSRFNLAVYFDEIRKKVVIKFRNPIVGLTKYIDLTKISSTPKLKEASCKKGLQLKSDANEDDPFSLPDSKKVDDIIEIDINTKALHASQYIKKYDELYLYEYELPAFSVDQKAKDLRLIFAAPTRPITGIADTYYSALIEEANKGYFFESIYAEYWDQYVRFLLNRRTVKAMAEMQMPELLALNFESKFRIGEINYFIKELDVTFNMQNIEVAKLELYST